MSGAFTSDEIIKLASALIGSVHPVADSAIDWKVEENLKTMIDVINWALGEMSEVAGNRHSFYGSQRDVGERAYAALLEWEEWLRGVEEELS